MTIQNASSFTARQRGIALLVTLLLLVVLTLAAVAAMRGTAVQERMAVAQVQVHSSFLDSEQLVWDAAACIRTQYIDADDEFIVPLPDTADVIAACGAASLADGAVITWDDTVQPWRYNVVASRTFADTGAVTPVALEVFTPGSDGSGNPLPNLPRLAPYACFGANCALTTAPSSASPTADGTNRLSPEIGERCQIQGSNRPAVDPEGGSVPGVIMPEGEIIRSGNPNRLPIEGEPPLINDPDAWVNNPAYIPDPEAYINGIVDPILDALGGSGRPDGPLQNGQAGVFVAGPNDTIRISGGESTAFGLIIVDGGTLELQGNQCFVGSVIFRNGGTMVTASGTPAVVGSVIGYAPEDGDIINPALNGNPSFYYSGRAMEIAEDIIGSILGPGYIFEIARWRAPIASGS